MFTHHKEVYLETANKRIQVHLINQNHGLEITLIIQRLASINLLPRYLKAEESQRSSQLRNQFAKPVNLSLKDRVPHMLI